MIWSQTILNLEDFSALISTIHNAAIAPGHWQNVLHGIVQAIGASAGALFVDGGYGVPDNVTTTDFDVAALSSYEQHYRTVDPVVPALLRLPEGSVVTQAMVIPKSEMIRTEFYNDWLSPQSVDDCLAATVSGDAKRGVLVFAVPARVGNFDADAIRTMQLLTPHVCMAVQTHRHLRGLNLQRNGAVAALEHLSCAIIIVHGNAQVAWTNRAGERLLAERHGLSARSASGLEAATTAQTEALRCLIAIAAGFTEQPIAGGSLSLVRPSGDRPLMVLVIPLDTDVDVLTKTPAGKAMVLVAPASNDWVISSKLLQEMFGLTPAETRIAQLIAKGGGVQAAAATVGIAPSTAKTHLLRVFAKTGTARQAELVQLFSHLTHPPVTDLPDHFG